MSEDIEVTIDVHETVNFTDAEKAKYARAIKAAAFALNSKMFKDELMKLKLTSAEGHTNQQVYDMIRSGVDKFNKEVDHDLDVYVTMYYKNNSVVGYTNPSTNKTWLNRKFFSQYDEADIACNLVHEWLHKAGFDHISASEHTSVPYAVGYLVEKVIREIYLPNINNPKPEPVPVPEPKPEPQPEPKPEPPAPEPEKVWVCRRVWWKLWLGKVCSWE
jgi:hypothetical protein